MDWDPPSKPAELTEHRLLRAILDGVFPPGSTLPGERELARRLGVTRPTLREALQRLARDGWLEIHQGRPTRVRDYWRDGNLNVLSAMVRVNHTLPPDFVTNLLEVRAVLAPAYTRSAVKHGPREVIALLENLIRLDDTPEAFAEGDWSLHRQLTLSAGNPVYVLLLNGFQSFYEKMALTYFSSPQARNFSRAFYRDLLDAFERGDQDAAEEITRRVMLASIHFWRLATDGRMEKGDEKME